MGLVAGPVPSDQLIPAEGLAQGTEYNPVLMGGQVDDTSPAAAGEGDARRLRVTPEGNQISELYRDNISALFLDDAAWTVATNPVFPIGALADEASSDNVDEDDVGALGMTLKRELHAVLFRRGAGEVLGSTATINLSTTRATFITPTAGKKIRIIAIICSNDTVTGAKFEWYFGTGTDIGTTAAKAIADFQLDADTVPLAYMVYPDGAGPVGAADDVLSIRISASIATQRFVVLYREE